MISFVAATQLGLLVTPQLSRHYAPHHAHLRSVAMTLKEPAAMRAKELKAELTTLGVSTADCFEKEDLVMKLAAARLNPPPPAASPAPAPPPPPPSPSPAPAPAPASAPVTSAADREEVAAMKVKEIKAELTQLGASTVGLLEKSEFVEALLAAREAAAEREANAEPEPVYDADVNEGQTQKMPKVRVQSNPSSLAQSNSLVPTLAPRLTRTSPTTNPTLITLKLTLTRRASSRAAAAAACPAAWAAWAACRAAWVAWAAWAAWRTS